MNVSTRLIMALFVLLTSNVALAQTDNNFRLETKPVWEVGFGAGYFSSYDYPGSKDPNIARGALPFFVYRSEVFRMGDGGFGAVAVEEPRFKVDVSLGGALNAKSRPDSVRAGMPDLDLLFEFGPRIQYRIYERQWNDESRSILDWDAKLRAVISTDFKGVQSKGFVFSTGFAYRQKAIIGDLVDLVVNTDITVGDQRYNNNFYSVSPEYVTNSRSSYRAKAGYVESRLFFGFGIKPTPTLSLFTGIGLFSYANSANEESPLFETDSSLQYAIGLAWAPFRSKNTIDIFASD